MGGKGVPEVGYHEEVLTAFAVHAAGHERTIRELLEAFVGDE